MITSDKKERMTLDEAIKHCYEVANSTPCNAWEKECNDDHLQLAKWLEELKIYRSLDKIDDLMTPLECAELNGDI